MKCGTCNRCLRLVPSVPQAVADALCRLYHSDARYRALWDAAPPPNAPGVVAAARSAVLPPARGPGTELKALLAELGLAGVGGCGCEERAALMDHWGVAGCTERRSEITDWLRQALAQQGWGRKLTAALRAVVSGVALRLSPADPLGSLVDLAIERAVAKGVS